MWYNKVIPVLNRFTFGCAGGKSLSVKRLKNNAGFIYLFLKSFVQIFQPMINF